MPIIVALVMESLQMLFKKILLVLICLIFSSNLAFAEHGTKKEKGYGATQPSKMKGVNIYKSGFY